MREELIHLELAHAGLDLNDPKQVRFEIPVDRPYAEQWARIRTGLGRVREC